MLPSFLAGLWLVCASAGARAQTTSSPGKTTTTSKTPSSTSSVAAATHTVAVGAQGGFQFEPNNITAAKGDTVLFRFYPGGHAVARSDFEFPCIPYELTGVNHIGFFSKFQNPQVVSNNLPTFSVKINDTQPIFFYCPAPGSCTDHHMIGAINPNSTRTLERQQELVKSAKLQLTPGESWPVESPLPTGSAQPPPPAASQQPGQQPGGGNSASPSPNLSAAQIAGIAIGGAALLVLVGALLFICGRKSRGSSSRSSREILPPTPGFSERSPLAARAVPAALDLKQPQIPSPGQATFSTILSPYSAMPVLGQDPYRVAGAGGPNRGHHQPHSQDRPHYHAGSRTPPFSPGSFLPYPPIPGRSHQVPPPGTRPTAQDGTLDQQWSQDPGVYGEVGILPNVVPVELSAAPRSPPLPAYQPRKFSFSSGAEAAFRPGTKP